MQGPRIAPLLLATLFALFLAPASPIRGEDERPRRIFVRDPFDVGDDKDPRPLGKRVPVLFVHGMSKDYLAVSKTIDLAFSALHGKLAKLDERGQEPFRTVMPLYYNYAPDRAYPVLANELVEELRTRYPAPHYIFVVHSAGALLARHAAASIKVAAVIGMAPAHGGSPGASLMYANEAARSKVGDDHYETLVATRTNLGVPDETARSVVWENTDGVLTPEDRKQFDIPVQSLPPMTYPRYDHYGELTEYRDTFGGLFGGGGKDSSQRCWAVLGAWSPSWARSDSVVIPYPEPAGTKAPAPVWSKTYPQVAHREIFLEDRVVDSVWDQIQETIARVAPDAGYGDEVRLAAKPRPPVPSNRPSSSEPSTAPDPDLPAEPLGPVSPARRSWIYSDGLHQQAGTWVAR